MTVTDTAYAHPQTMDAQEADRTAVIKRQVNYSCSIGNRLTVVYGFNQQKLPTYAQATLNGKSRFLPINLVHSDDTSTLFGDENNFMLSTGSALTYSHH